MTFSTAVKPFPGTLQLVSVAFTSPSSDTRPASTRCKTPRAETGLLIEPAWKRVAVVTGACEVSSTTP